MRRVKQVLSVVLPGLVLGLIVPAASPAAIDMFLKVDGIQGESRDTRHRGEIDVLAWSWGVSNDARATDKSRKGAAPSVQDLSLTKWVDKSSPQLLSHVFSGGRAASALLTVRKAGQNPVDYLKICMRDVGVSALNTGGSGGEDRLTENITLNFGAVSLIYQEQASDGRPVGDPFASGWDLVRNVALGEPGCGPGA